MEPSPLADPGTSVPEPSILIVDDNQVIASTLASLLNTCGYRTTVRFCAADALLFAAQSTGDLPAAALVDVHLPDLSGLVLSGKLRECFGPDIPIIILSGDTSMEVLNSLPHVGATYFISKPVDLQILLERLDEWVGH